MIQYVVFIQNQTALGGKSACTKKGMQTNAYLCEYIKTLLVCDFYNNTLSRGKSRDITYNKSQTYENLTILAVFCKYSKVLRGSRIDVFLYTHFNPIFKRLKWLEYEPRFKSPSR